MATAQGFGLELLDQAFRGFGSFRLWDGDGSCSSACSFR